MAKNKDLERKNTPDTRGLSMPLERKNTPDTRGLSMPLEYWDKIEQDRGDVNRSKYIFRIIEAYYKTKDGNKKGVKK